VGKGWAKGLTAATDSRVARAAAAHRGKIYQRRKPFEECRWRTAGHTTLPLTWSDEMAYIVGLTATDGCLITGRRVINFKSEDRQLVETYLGVLGRTNRIRKEKTHKPGGVVYTTQFGDSRLDEWFRSVGLTPRKSLTLGSICAPDRFIVPLARGLMDGDGGIANFVHAPTLATYPSYRYERLIVSFNSASKPHLEWLRENVIGERESECTPDQRSPGHVPAPVRKVREHRTPPALLWRPGRTSVGAEVADLERVRRTNVARTGRPEGNRR